MSAASDEHVYDDLPKGLTLGAARGVWFKREQVDELHRQGKTIKEISGTIHEPQKAVEWAITKLEESPPSAPPDPTPQGFRDGDRAGGTESGPDVVVTIPPGAMTGPGSTTEGTGVGAGGQAPARAREDNEAPNARDPVPRRPPAADVTTGAGAHGTVSRTAPPGPAVPSRQEMSAAMESIALSDVGAPAHASSLVGSAEMPDMYARLADICRMFGMQSERARGVAVAFSFQARDPRDTRKLGAIIAGLGYPPAYAEQIVETWKAQNPSVFDGGSSSSSPGEPDIGRQREELRRWAGLAGPGSATGPEDETSALLRRKATLENRQIELAIQEKEKALGLQPGSLPGGAQEDDPVVTVMLNINGFPVERRIRQSQQANYAQWMTPPNAIRPAGSDPEMPPWAKAMQDQLAGLRGEREEDRRTREMQEAITRATAPLAEKLSQLTAAPPGPSPADLRAERVEREFREYKEGQEAKRTALLEQQVRDLGQQYNLATSPEGLANARHNLEAGIRRLGYVPASESGALSREQILLEAESKAITRKDEATGRAIDIVGRRVDGKPGIELADKLGLTGAAKDFLRKYTTTPDERAGMGQTPSDQELAEAAAALENRAAPPAPPAPPAGERQPPGPFSQGRNT
jgi:hypothetical protein